MIDWADATRGDPMGDLARTRLLFQLGAVQDYMPGLIHRLQASGRGVFVRLYMRAYRRVHAIDDDRLQRWEIVRAADRIAEGIDSELPALLELLERRANV